MSDWKASWEARKARLPADTNAFRWVDGPDTTVDVFADVAVLSIYKALSSSAERQLAQDAFESAPLRAVYLKRRPREAYRAKEATVDVAPTKPLCGTPIDALEILEGGARLEIRPPNGLSVGLYLDGRDARAWVRAHASGRTVLNLFAYTCGFGVAARLGGAERAVNVDLSRKVLEWGEQNLATNGFSPAHRDFISGDCFEWLARFAKKSERFDLVVVDPPSFSNTSGRRFRAETDYAGLVTAASKVVAPGGLLLACCNLETMGAARLDQLVSTGLSGAGKKLESFGASTVDFTQPSAFKALAVQL